MFNLAVVVPFVINSELAKKHATDADPWALAWLKGNEAGGGAYRVESWKPGSETILARFDNWKSGPLPKLRRIIARDVPSAGTRRAMLERGDADVSTGFPPKDFDQMIKEGKVKVVGVPIPNGLWYVALNTSRPPFDNVKLRQAIAWAMPYEQIQAAPSSAARSRCMAAARWRRRCGRRLSRTSTDLDKAKALMAEAGFASGLETSISLDVGTATVGEPTAVLIQESLGKIGIKVVIEKIPGANWRTTLNKKELPMVLNRFSGWLDYPEYYFFWNFHGNNSIFNISAYKNPAMDQLIDTRALHRGQGRVREEREGFRRAVHAARCRSSRSTSRSTTWRCRRRSAATSSGSTASPTSGSSTRAEASCRRPGGPRPTISHRETGENILCRIAAGLTRINPRS